LIASSPLQGRYDKPIDRESAYEVLMARKGLAPEGQARRAPRTELADQAGEFLGTAAGQALKSMRQAANQLGRQLVRGLMGSLLGHGKRRCGGPAGTHRSELLPHWFFISWAWRAPPDAPALPAGRVADAVGRGLNGGAASATNPWYARRTLLHGRRLHLEQDARQVGELVKHLQLPLQAFLLITQARGPMAVGDNQQQLPSRHDATWQCSRAAGCSWLSSRRCRCKALAWPRMALSGLASRSRTAGAGCKRAKCHDQTPEVTERHGSRKRHALAHCLHGLPIKSTSNFCHGLKFSKKPLF
jgi:hypothetical protein